MSSINKGNFSLERRLLESDLWLSEKFTWGQAWVDMIGLANYEDSSFRIRNIKIEVKRGQLAWSSVNLAQRWHWSRNKLRNFLNVLKKDQQIIVESKQQNMMLTTIITIINYESYQRKSTAEYTKKGTPDSTAKRHQTVQQKDTSNTNNTNNTNNVGEENLAKHSNEINEIFRLFYESINPQVNFGNKTDRKALEFLISKYSYEKVLKFTKYAISIQGLEFAPVITTPSELKNRLAKLGIYFKKEKNNKQQQKGFVSL